MKGAINPRVISIVSRFLEHSRVYYFRNGAQDPLDGTMYISSADPMHRNLHRRVEVAVPLLERLSRERVWELLSAQLHDAVSAWELQPDGSYIERQPEAGPVSMSSQQLLMKLYRDRARQAAILGRG
jgi:polyphosphate kinase